MVENLISSKNILPRIKKSHVVLPYPPLENKGLSDLE